MATLTIHRHNPLHEQKIDFWEQIRVYYHERGGINQLSEIKD
jgi:hypothetical protein